MLHPVHVSGTEPYSWPYDGRLDPVRFALVICGAQRELMNASANAHQVSAVLQSACRSTRRSGGTVVWVRHGTRGGQRRGTASLPTRGTNGWQIGVEHEPADVIVDAAGWDGNFASDLDHVLRDMSIESIAFGGFASEITVDSTLRTLNDRGHECLILTDACAPLDPAVGRRAHSSVTMSGGIFGALGITSELIAALEQDSPLLESELRS